MTNTSFLNSHVQGQIAHVRLNRPPVNAVNSEMYRQILECFSNVDRLGTDVRSIVVSGMGPHFCAGHEAEDFRKLTSHSVHEEMRAIREAFWAIYSCRVPVIAAVHGAVLGTGLAIAASCDFVIASEDSLLGLPEIKVGVMGGAKHLSRLMPQSLVRLMFYTGEPLPAEEFLKHGGIVRMVERDRLLDEAMTIAQRITRHAPVAIEHAKRSLTEIEFADLRRGYEFEQSLTCLLVDRPEWQAGLSHFGSRD